MTGYIAFLRGINVSGQKIIKMEDLKESFISFGLKNVKTFIQSGNVLFESTDADPIKLNSKIGKKLSNVLGYEVPILLRTVAEMEGLIQSDPFKGLKPKESEKMYVTFMNEEPKQKHTLPLFSSKKDVEIFRMYKQDAFCISHRINGSFGFPNAFIEKELKVVATTRNWTTVNKIMALAKRG